VPLLLLPRLQQQLLLLCLLADLQARPPLHWRCGLARQRQRRQGKQGGRGALIAQRRALLMPSGRSFSSWMR
jgi:hypothetical protein